MIKFMDRSIWYYIKRPRFSFWLLFYAKHVRLYSLFVMDLIEQDLLELKIPKYCPYRTWYIKCTDEKLYTDDLTPYVYQTLIHKKREYELEERLRSSQTKISKVLNLLKGENTQNG